MKKFAALMLAVMMLVCIAACGEKEEAVKPAEVAEKAQEAVAETAEKAEEKVEEAVEEKAEETVAAVEEKAEEAVAAVEEKVEETVAEAAAAVEEAAAPAMMSHADYAAAELDSAVAVTCFVQNHQSWWDNKITVYAADKDGAYFLYNMACTEEDAAKLVPGTKIIVNGFKSEWSGEVEITDATFTFADDGETFISEPADVTALLASEELIAHQNEFVAFTGMTVAASKNADGADVAFLYNWDGSGSHDANSDLYFNVTVDGNTYNFTVESYLCGNETEVYKTVEGLKIGDTVDMQGFLYWYNGVNPHITSVTVK